MEQINQVVLIKENCEKNLQIINNQNTGDQYFLVWKEYPLPLTPELPRLDFLS
jgi:hypothetical protein